MMNIDNMIAKYHISLERGNNIKCEINHNSIVQSEIAWIKEHKAEIIDELNRRAEIAKAQQEEIDREIAEVNKAFEALRVNNPEMRIGDCLTDKAIYRVIKDGWSIEGAQAEYRSLYANVMDSRF